MSRGGGAPQTLTGRIYATLLVVAIVAASVATIASALLHQATVMAEAQTELGYECDVVASTLDAASDEVAELGSLDLGEMRATLVTPEGEVLFDSMVAPTTMLGHDKRPEVAEALSTGRGSSLRASDTLGNVSLYQARLLRSGNVIRLSSDRAGIWTILAGDLGILGLILLALVIVSWVAARKLATRLVKPILGIDVTQLSAEAPYEELEPLTKRLAEQQAELLSQMEELRRADVMRQEFTANVTHELKTPIASIMGASELLRDGFVLEEDVPDFAARINNESQRLSALVNDILMLSKLDESERLRSPEAFGAVEPVDLYAISRDVIGRMSGRADYAEVSLIAIGESSVVSGYPRLLDELVANLCSNAIRYNRPGGSVTVWTGRRNGRPAVEVTDSGIGIPPEAQTKVFERFYRVETSRSRASGGTGLGLAIVKHTAALHGAEVFLESEMGKGTTVTVVFPPTEAHLPAGLPTAS